jgi:hypothetical protein
LSAQLELQNVWQLREGETPEQVEADTHRVQMEADNHRVQMETRRGNWTLQNWATVAAVADDTVQDPAENKG